MSNSYQAKKITTEELIIQWLHGLSPNTVRSYKQYLNRFLAHVDKPLDEVTLFDVQTWLLALRQQMDKKQRWTYNYNNSVIIGRVKTKRIT